MENEKSRFFVSVVIPIDSFGPPEARAIFELQQNLDEYYWDYEIILVASKEIFKNCQSEILSMLEHIPSIRFMQLQSKLSKEVLFECGAESSIGDFVVLFELHNDPVQLIREAIEESAKGIDIIVGVSNFHNSIFYETGRVFASLLLKLADYNIPKDASNFRVLSRRSVNAIFSTGRPNQDFFMRIQNSGFDTGKIYYRSLSKIEKKIKEGLRKTLDLMVFNSLKPLRIVSLLGFLGSVSAFFFAFYSLLVQLFKTNVVEGWTSIFLLISFFFLLQFLMLSFISEYLARLLKELNRESDYAVVFEKTSTVMVNRDRINVMDKEESADNNLVQTGRNK